jgi:hypothetical protein
LPTICRQGTRLALPIIARGLINCAEREPKRVFEQRIAQEDPS